MQLRSYELQIVPRRQLLAGHPHGSDGTVRSNLLQTVFRETADVIDVRFLWCAVHVLVGALVLVALERRSDPLFYTIRS